MVRRSLESSKQAADRARRRQAGLERFARWQEGHLAEVEPAAALSGVGLLYDLLPPEARRRPVDASGIQRLHRSLSVLAARTR